MDCDVCDRPLSASTRPSCPTCVRTALYPLRIAQATVLLDKERVGSKIEAVIAGGRNTKRQNLSLSGAIIDTAECGKSHELESMRNEAAALNNRLEAVAAQATLLRTQVDDLRKFISTKRAQNAQRKSDAESARFNLDERSQKELEAVQSSSRRRARRWELNHTNLIVERTIHCRDAAKLFGLRRRKYMVDGEVAEVFTIGDGWQLYDIREMYDAPIEELNSSLTQATLLTSRVANYLGLRLPAEIILPHHDCPLPTILPTESSYANRNVIFPRLTSRAASSSPATSRVLDQRPTAKARPLFLVDPLKRLLKDDTTALGLFVEGVSLLAWNIAWLCKTQGMDGYSTWKDVCPMGSNLWRLLQAPQSSRVSRTDSAKIPDVAEGEKEKASRVPVVFGVYSHNTTHSFLGAEGNKLLEEWELRPSVMRSCVLEIRQYLVKAIQGPEWELIDGKEGADEYDTLAKEEPVVIPYRGLLDRGLGRRSSTASVPSATSSTTNGVPGSRRLSGVSTPGAGKDLRQQAMEAAASNHPLLIQGRKPSIANGSAASSPAADAAKSQASNNGWMKVRSRNSSIAEGGNPNQSS